MGKSNDVEQIPGHEYMDEKDKAYFQKFGTMVDKQAELIAEQNDIDPETMNAEFERFMDILRYNFNEYLVEGAPLTCSMRTMELQQLLNEKEVILSQPRDVENMAKLQLIGNRQETINGFTPMNVSDTRGGLRDKRIDYKSNDEKGDLNIVSFGNCKCVKSGTSLQALAVDLYSKFGMRNNGRTVNKLVQQMEEAIQEGKGTCFCCMLLNPVWENLPTEYDISTGEFEFRLSLGGVSEVLFGERYMHFNGKEGINMMSMLFCKQGGIIRALESGQYIYDNLTDEEVLLIKTIYGEANLCSKYAWQAIANLIMNRVGVREWKNYTSVTEVIMNSGFDAYTYKNEPYQEAEAYFADRDYSNDVIEEMIRIVIPVYRGQTEDITGGAVLYYSPEAQKKLHDKNPQRYAETPKWDFSQLQEVEIEGLENDDLIFYRYK